MPFRSEVVGIGECIAIATACVMRRSKTENITLNGVTSEFEESCWRK